MRMQRELSFSTEPAAAVPRSVFSLSLLFLYIFSLYAVRSVCVCRDPKTGPNPPVFSSSNQPPSSLFLFPPSIAINTHTPAGNIFPRIFFFFLLCQLWKRERDASTWNSKLDKHKRSVLTRIPPLFFPPLITKKCRFTVSISSIFSAFFPCCSHRFRMLCADTHIFFLSSAVFIIWVFSFFSLSLFWRFRNLQGLCYK